MQEKMLLLYEALKQKLGRIERRSIKVRRLQRIIYGFSALMFVFTIGGFLLTSVLAPMLKDSGVLSEFISLYAKNAYYFIAVFMVGGILMSFVARSFGATLQKLRAEEQEVVSRVIEELFPALKRPKELKVTMKNIKKSKLFLWVESHHTEVPPLATFGILQYYTQQRVMSIADVGIMQAGRRNKLMQVPGLGALAMFRQFFGRNLTGREAADHSQYDFRGLFCYTKYPKRLSGTTVILPSKMEQRWGFLAKVIQSLNFNRDQLVLLEDRAFQDEFVVYSTDQVEARYVLSSKMMRRILLLKQKFDRPIMVSFVDRRIYIAIQSPFGIFSLNYKALKTAAALQEVHDDIRVALDIVEELDIENPIRSNV